MKTLFLKGLLSGRTGERAEKASADGPLEFLSPGSPTLRKQLGVTEEQRPALS